MLRALNRPKVARTGRRRRCKRMLREGKKPPPAFSRPRSRGAPPRAASDGSTPQAAKAARSAGSGRPPAAGVGSSARTAERASTLFLKGVKPLGSAPTPKGRSSMWCRVCPHASSTLALALPGPETGVFGVYAPCAPIQKSHTKRMKTLRALNRPKAARTSAQEDDRAVQRAAPPRDCPAGRIILRQCTPPSSSGPEIGSSPALQRVQGSRTRPSARCTAARHRHLRGRRERDSIASCHAARVMSAIALTYYAASGADRRRVR